MSGLLPRIGPITTDTKMLTDSLRRDVQSLRHRLKFLVLLIKPCHFLDPCAPFRPNNAKQIKQPMNYIRVSPEARASRAPQVLPASPFPDFESRCPRQS